MHPYSPSRCLMSCDQGLLAVHARLKTKRRPRFCNSGFRILWSFFKSCQKLIFLWCNFTNLLKIISFGIDLKQRHAYFWKREWKHIWQCNVKVRNYTQWVWVITGWCLKTVCCVPMVIVNDRRHESVPPVSNHPLYINPQILYFFKKKTKKVPLPQNSY